MIIQDETRLKTWVSNLVADISDAEPDALAKYVLALVKKPLSDAELEKLCSEKLSVFLQTHTEDFVRQLFVTLKSESYLATSIEKGNVQEEEEIKKEEKTEDLITTETDELVLTDPESEHEPEPEPSPVEKEPPKKAAPSRSKESSSSTSYHSKTLREVKTTKADSSRPSKEDSRKLAIPETTRRIPSPAAPATKPQRKRISPPRSTSAERRTERRPPPQPVRRRVIIGGGGNSNAGGGGDLRAQPSRHFRDVRRGRSKSRSRSPHIRKEKRIVEIDSRSMRRHRCRDFHEKGFCMRGDICPYDHGPDPVVVEDSALEKIVCSGNVFDPNAYGVNPPPPGVENTKGAGKLINSANTTEGYNPEAPALTTPSVAGIDFSVPPPPIPQIVQQRPQMSSHQMIYPPGTAQPVTILPTYSSSAGLVQIRPAILPPASLPAQTTTIYGANSSGQMSTFGTGANGMMMRGGRYKPYNLANRNTASRSLLVKKVPQELNKIAQLDQHFSKFGQVNNIQVQYEGHNDTALVTFKTRRDAMMAYKSTEPIFNNRFIKVFWQNETQQGPQTFDNEGNDSNSVAEGKETGIASSESKATIPFASGPVMKPRYTLPRYFKKTFTTKPADEQKQFEEGKIEEDTKGLEENQKEATPDEAEEKSPRTGQVPAPMITQQLVAPSAAPTQQFQSMDGTKAAEMKRKSDKEALAKLMEVHKMKANIYGKLMDQQKALLHKLKKTEDKDQKKKLMELLKKAEEPAKKVEAELEELGTKVREVQQHQQSRKRFRKADSTNFY